MAPFSGKKRTSAKADLVRLDYRPPGSKPFDLEVCSVSDLRRRVSGEFLRATHRYGFHMFLCVTRGECTHLVDFEPVNCKPGSLLAIQPAQAHRFGADRHWDGWIVMFQPDFLLFSSATAPDSAAGLPSGPDSLPPQLRLEDHELGILTSAVEQMHEDARLAAPAEQVQALLRHQMYTLLLRLTVLHDRQEASGSADGIPLRRFRLFRRLVEKKFPEWHGVAEYASQLGCSAKSLTRASMAGSGVNAKDFVVARINLEAKRLLAHTVLPIAAIGERLGFQEPTNFVKFFRRTVGCSPGHFRRQQVAGARGV